MVRTEDCITSLAAAVVHTGSKCADTEKGCCRELLQASAGRGSTCETSPQSANASVSACRTSSSPPNSRLKPFTKMVVPSLSRPAAHSRERMQASRCDGSSQTSNKCRVAKACSHVPCTKAAASCPNAGLCGHSHHGLLATWPGVHLCQVCRQHRRRRRRLGPARVRSRCTPGGRQTRCR